MALNANDWDGITNVFNWNDPTVANITLELMNLMVIAVFIPVLDKLPIWSFRMAPTVQMGSNDMLKRLILVCGNSLLKC